MKKLIAALSIAVTLVCGWAARQPIVTGIALTSLALTMNASPALASNCSPFTYTLTNGTTADANQVMANFNTLLTCANSSLAHNGVNSDITSLTGLTTPLPYSEGGTGTTTSTPVIPWAIAAGSADVITASYLPANASLFDGLVLGFRASASNATTTPTFNADVLGAHTITKSGGSALAAGDIPGGLAEMIVRYNLANTRWELLNPGAIAGAASTGTGAVVRQTSPTLITPALGVATASSINSNTFTTATATYTGTNGAVYTFPATTQTIAGLGVNQSWTKGQIGVASALSDAAPTAIDLATSNNFTWALTGNHTLSNPSNAVAGQSGVIAITPTGAFTPAFGTNYVAVGGVSALSFTASTSLTDLLPYYVIDSTHILLAATIKSPTH